MIIPYSKTVKNLGIIFDHTLSWIPQVNEVSRKIFAASHSLRRLQNFLPYSTKVTLAQSLLLPILDYADVCYLDLTEALLDKLERLQNLCIRFIFGLRKYDHVSHYRSQLKWLPIRFRRNCHILTLLYSVLNNTKAPEYLRSRFTPLSSHGLSLRSSNINVLAIPRHTSDFYSSSFTVQAVRLWNSLPHSIRSSESIWTFKTKVKLFYLNKTTV